MFPRFYSRSVTELGIGWIWLHMAAALLWIIKNSGGEHFCQVCHELILHPPWVTLWFASPTWSTALLSALCPKCCFAFCFLLYLLLFCLSPPKSSLCHKWRLPVPLVTSVLQIIHPLFRGCADILLTSVRHLCYSNSILQYQWVHLHV